MLDYRGWTRCRPPPGITWSRSGLPLSTRENRVRYRWSVGNHTLHIARLTLDDGGRYQCNASNSEGSYIYSVNLRVYSIDAVFYYQHLQTIVKFILQLQCSIGVFYILFHRNKTVYISFYIEYRYLCIKKNLI